MEKIRLGETSWSATAGSPLPNPYCDLNAIKAAMLGCHHCKTTSKAIFEQGWACLKSLQLATWTYNRKHVNRLSKCIEKDITMTASEKRQWIEGKGKGKLLFALELGGSYEVFNVRPLAEEIAIYCTEDVRFMPKLWKQYFNKLSPSWARKVEVATKDRITLS